MGRAAISNQLTAADGRAATRLWPSVFGPIVSPSTHRGEVNASGGVGMGMTGRRGLGGGWRRFDMGSPTEAERSHMEGETPARGAGLKNGPPSFQASAVKG